MPYSNGVYSAPSSPGSFNPAITGQEAKPADWNALLQDMEAALSTCLLKDGTQTVTANIPLNNHKITGLADGTLPADATSLSQVQALIAAAVGAALPTGLIADFPGAVPAGWVLGWGTIGDASSGATNRANSDCENLFKFYWNNVADAQAPVQPGGRGATANDDWLAHKTIGVSDLRGRVRVGKDNMGGTAANRVTAGISGIAGTTLGAAGGNESMQQHAHGVTDPTHTHLTNADNVSLGSSGGGNALWQSGSGNPVTSAPSSAGITIQNAGAGGSQNMPPAMIFNAIIKL